MAEKIDMYKLDKEATEHVKAFIQAEAEAEAIKRLYRNAVKAFEKDKENANTEKELLIVLDNITKLELYKADRLKNCKYTKTEADRTLLKIFKNQHSLTAAQKAVKRWFLETFKVELNDMAFVKAILSAGGKKQDMKQFVNSKGMTLTKYNGSNMLRMAYGVVYEKMVAVKFISATDASEMVVDNLIKSYDNFKLSIPKRLESEYEAKLEAFKKKNVGYWTE